MERCLQLVMCIPSARFNALHHVSMEVYKNTQHMLLLQIYYHHAAESKTLSIHHPTRLFCVVDADTKLACASRIAWPISVPHGRLLASHRSDADCTVSGRRALSR